MRFFFGLALIVGVGLGSTRTEAAAPNPCPPTISGRGESYELGLVYLSFIPANLPDLSNPLSVFGPVLGAPIWGGTLQLQAVLGNDGRTGLGFYLAETNYRVELNVPFFDAFLLLGGHYLNYALTGLPTQVRWGANAGVGLSLAMGKGFELVFSLRTYIEKYSSVAVGGGFSFLL